MNVVKAAVFGCCMGVRRALAIAYTQVCASGHVYTMGPLIHNPQVLSDLAAHGVRMLSEETLPEHLSGEEVVIIRAHGITPQLETTLVSRGAVVVDATCPKVKANQKKAQHLFEAGYRVFLAGERYHGEIISLQGYAPGCIVVADPAEAERAAAQLYREEPASKIVLLGQTTISANEYTAISQAIAHYFPDIAVIDTICTATRDRQDALRNLCAVVDAVVVIGGHESANTRRLVAVAQETGIPVWLVEGIHELPAEIVQYATIGISAGASTPDEVIGEIEKALACRGSSRALR